MPATGECRHCDPLLTGVQGSKKSHLVADVGATQKSEKMHVTFKMFSCGGGGFYFELSSSPAHVDPVPTYTHGSCVDDLRRSNIDAVRGRGRGGGAGGDAVIFYTRLVPPDDGPVPSSRKIEP